MKLSTAILGASGYTGGELLRLLFAHARLVPTLLAADSSAGALITSLHPHLTQFAGQRFVDMHTCHEDLKRCEVVFSALPHGASMGLLPALDNRLVVDLGADFRLQMPELYSEWYGLQHAAPGSLTSWVYGLPEFFSAQVRAAGRVANPGCYATAIALAFAPLCQNRLIEGTLVADAYSGLSGAGRNAKSHLQLSAAAEDLRAYRVAAHQHTPEIEQTLATVSGAEWRLSFTPHLAPLVRGIHATCSAQLAAGIGALEVQTAFHAAYDQTRFVRVLDTPAGTKDVRGSNNVLLHAAVDTRCRRVIVTLVLDNLVKGAAGQAIQNANLALGFDEAEGLSACALYP